MSNHKVAEAQSNKGTKQQRHKVAKAQRISVPLCLCGCVYFFALSCHAADWPQWRGPNRDATCSETGLLSKWPDDGPKLLWQITGLGIGYSSMAIVDGRLYTMGDLPGQGPRAKTQCVIAYDLAKRQQLWQAEVGPPHGDGPRCTPTINEGLVYAIGTSGDLVCLSAGTGDLLWRKNLVRDFAGKNPDWRYSESPLVDGDKLVCTPGGRDAVMVALNKKTGELIWRCSMPDIGRKGMDEAGYASIVPAEAAGIRQYVQLINKGLIGVSAKDGRFLWGYNKIANGTANIPTAVVYGEYVFCSTAYGAGAALLKLVSKDNSVNAEEVYFLNANIFQNHHGGFVRVGDYIYGGHGHGEGKPTCIEMKTGKIMWQKEQPGGGSAGVLYADRHLYFRCQDDVVALIEANPQGYNLKSTFRLPRRQGMSGEGWPHPVISNGRLYIRHADVLLCYDVRSD